MSSYKAWKCAAALVCLAGALGSAGCTAILGSFEVSPASAPDGPDGEVDAATVADTAQPQTDAATTTEAATDAPADGPVLPFNCTVGASRELDLAAPGTPAYDPNFLRVFRAGAVVRVVARKTSEPGVHVFSHDPLAPVPSITALHAPAIGRPLDAVRLAGQAVIVVLVLEETPAIPEARVVVQELPDDDLTLATRLLASKAITIPPSTSDVSGDLVGYAAAREYGWAVSMQAELGSPGEQQILYGHRVPGATPPTPSVVYTGLPSGATTVKKLARSGSSFYAFDSKAPDGADTTATSYFRVPENGTATPIAPLPITPPNAKPQILITTGPAVGALRAAIADLGTAGPVPLAIRIGSIPDGDLLAIDATKVPVALTFASASETPFERGTATFFADDFVWAGLASDASKGMGVNFVWYDALAGVVRGRQVGATRLLPGHTGIEAASVHLVAKQPTQTDFDLAWIENDVNGSHLLHAPLSCK